MNVEQSEQVRIDSVECNVNFRFSCCSSFKARNGLEALFNLLIELVGSATTNKVIF